MKDSETANDDFPITIRIEDRIYDGSLGRCLSLDSFLRKYHHITPYSTFECYPIFLMDLKREFAIYQIKGNSITFETELFLRQKVKVASCIVKVGRGECIKTQTSIIKLCKKHYVTLSKKTDSKFRKITRRGDSAEASEKQIKDRQTTVPKCYENDRNW